MKYFEVLHKDVKNDIKKRKTKFGSGIFNIFSLQAAKITCFFIFSWKRNHLVITRMSSKNGPMFAATLTPLLLQKL